MAGQVQKQLGVALLGCGVVGGGTAVLLLKDKERMLAMTGCDLQLLYVVEKNPAHALAIGVPQSLIHDSLDAALADPAVDVVIELVGGTGIARELVSRALQAGKHVVTANKALLAKHGRELFAEARKNKVSIAFEASCGGGIPIIRALYDGLMANEITALYGIVNGTCNYILTEMLQKGKGYAEALIGAQAAGFAEADPTFDVKGIDASHKISILGGLAFGMWIEHDKVHTQGIDSLMEADVAAAIRLGYSLKLIAQARKTAAGVFVRVEPAFIARSHPLAWVNGSFNAVSVYGSSVGHTLYYGRGAGASPTASAVVADLLSIAAGTYPVLFDNLSIWMDRGQSAHVLDTALEERRFYLRLDVRDCPGNLADITRILGANKISVASIHQEEVGDDANQMVTVVIVLHSCVEGTIRKALEQILTLDAIGKTPSLLPILEEQTEFA